MIEPLILWAIYIGDTSLPGAPESAENDDADIPDEATTEEDSEDDADDMWTTADEPPVDIWTSPGVETGRAHV